MGKFQSAQLTFSEPGTMAFSLSHTEWLYLHLVFPARTVHTQKSLQQLQNHPEFILLRKDPTKASALKGVL